MEVNHADLRMLSNKGFVNENKLTQLGKLLLDKISITDKIKVSKKEMAEDDLLVNILTYVEIFPKITLPSGKLARVTPPNLIGAFNWFVERYNYSWDTIIKATTRYVKEFEMKRYQFMQTSQYFVRKQNVDKTWSSELANYCAVVDSVEDNDLSDFNTKVV